MRAALDRAGLRETRVLASGDMDEWSIAALWPAGPPSTASAGTSLGVGGAPWPTRRRGRPGGVCKEVAYVDEDGQERPRIKLAEKSTWPGRKEVYRLGRYEGGPDSAGQRAPPPGGRACLPVVRGGRCWPGARPR